MVPHEQVTVYVGHAVDLPFGTRDGTVSTRFLAELFSIEAVIGAQVDVLIVE